MKKQIATIGHILVALIFAVATTQCTTTFHTDKKPPTIQPQPFTENYFGVEVTDHYRNLENLEDTTVVNWMKDQADYSRNILDRIPGRQGLIDKMVEFDSRVSSRITYLTITENDRYFYEKTTPNDETSKLYYRDGYEGEEILLFDPETFDLTSDKKFAISSFTPSYKGDKIIIGVAPNGSESTDLIILNITNKTFYKDKIENLVFASPSWLPDGSGFFYNSAKSANVHDMDRQLNTKIYLHLIGNDPVKDVEIFSNEKSSDLSIQPEEVPEIEYNKGLDCFLAFLKSADFRQKVFYAPTSEFKKDKISWKLLFDRKDEVYDFYATSTDIFIYTPKNAPNYKILKVPASDPNLKNAEIFVPEDKTRILNSFTLTNKALYYSMSENGIQEKVFRKQLSDGKVTELELPFKAGATTLISKGIAYPEIWVTLSGWTSGSKRYRYLYNENEFRLESLTDYAEYPEYKNLVVEEVMVPSHDGVKVPLSLIYDKNLDKNGANPVYLWGYGSYGVSINPAFSPQVLLYTTKGGIVATAHVRGGGEMGDSWHKGGYKTTKPNSWKDFIACAEYLVNENYSSSKNIAIWSGSAGGILIGRAITERPDLFAAAITTVGCMNALRSEHSPNGAINMAEFGTSKDSVECMALIEMDSYLHLKKEEKYPATLITAGMNDPRVSAWEPAKFAAKMQEYNRSVEPILFLTDFESGHGVGDTKTKEFEKRADRFSFALWQSGHPDFQVK